MANKLTPIIVALNDLAKSVRDSKPDTATMKEQHGWNFPHLNAENIAKIVDSVRTRIESVESTRLNPEFKPEAMAARISTVRSEVIPYFWNGNGTEAFRSLTALLDWIDASFSALYVNRVDWEAISEQELMPPELTKRIRSVNARMKVLENSVGQLSEKIALIDNAHESALALPTDLETLDEARDRIKEVLRSSEKDAAYIATAAEKTPTLLSAIEAGRDQAVKLVARTEDAYSAATTLGHGAAFDAKARSLAKSMWVWVAGLFLALGIGGSLGFYRISVLERLIDDNTASGVIWINLAMAAFSIAAPVWFAWVATKQVGQRFRLSEDYAFKASVAKAYEGYRREAVRLDADFEKRLFGSALDRLDEAPLRFVELESHGSPWTEVFNLRRSRSEKDYPNTKNGTLRNNQDEGVKQDIV